MAYPLLKWAVILGGRLLHEVSSRHNGRRFCLSCIIRLRFYKRDFPDLNLQPQGYLYFRLGHYTTLFLPCQWRSPCHSIAIRRPRHHSLENRRHLRYSHAKSRRIRHYCEILWSLRSYAHDLCHWLILTTINIFLISSAKKSQSTCPRPVLRPIQTTLLSNQTILCPIQKTPSVILVWVWWTW